MEEAVVKLNVPILVAEDPIKANKHGAASFVAPKKSTYRTENLWTVLPVPLL